MTLPLIKVVGIVEENIARSERGSGPRPKRRAQIADNADELVSTDAEKDAPAEPQALLATPKEVAADGC